MEISTFIVLWLIAVRILSRALAAQHQCAGEGAHRKHQDRERDRRIYIYLHKGRRHSLGVGKLFIEKTHHLNDASLSSRTHRAVSASSQVSSRPTADRALVVSHK